MGVSAFLLDSFLAGVVGFYYHELTGWIQEIFLRQHLFRKDTSFLRHIRLGSRPPFGSTNPLLCVLPQ
jgi:hypothetical protein